MNQRLFIFLIVFTAMNLVFVPLLSLYGLRVCPVLSIPGFGFGCYYAAAYIAVTNVANLSIIFLSVYRRGILPEFFHRPGNRLWMFAGAYILATGLALVLLQIMLKMNHLTTNSRAPEILTLASLLLGITQVYGLNWALANSSRDNEAPKTVTFQRRWFSHVARMMLPVMVVAAVLLHFLISQSLGFNDGKTAPVAASRSWWKFARDDSAMVSVKYSYAA